jgi:hypothetical protein
LSRLYHDFGISALLLQVFYGIRSERQLMEQLDYNLLYRWFAGLAPDDPVWDTTTFTKNRDRLQHGEVFQKFMTKLLNHPQVKPLLRFARGERDDQGRRDAGRLEIEAGQEPPKGQGRALDEELRSIRFGKIVRAPLRRLKSWGREF